MKATTKKKISATLESYLESIKSLQRKYGAVRVTDLAERMGCKMPSVTSALRRLVKIGLINYETYRPVTLTRDGEKTVQELNSRHRILADFFKTVLGLDPEFSEAEACRLEHRISPEILHRLETLMAFIRSDPDQEKQMAEFCRNFQHFADDRGSSSPL